MYFSPINSRAIPASYLHTKGSDNTTAAKRLFSCEHENLFESLVANVRIPGKPQQQHHDPFRRKTGWEKRRSAQEGKLAA